MDIDAIRSKVSEIVSGCSDLSLYSLEYKKEGEENQLEIIVDKKGFVDSDEIEAVTEKINEYLDKEDPIEEEYCLLVTSRGLEKDFEFDDAEYYKGEWIEVKTFEQTQTGELVEVTSDSITINNAKNKKIKIKANDITNIRIVVKF